MNIDRSRRWNHLKGQVNFDNEFNSNVQTSLMQTETARIKQDKNNGKLFVLFGWDEDCFMITISEWQFFMEMVYLDAFECCDCDSQLLSFFTPPFVMPRRGSL